MIFQRRWLTPTVLLVLSIVLAACSGSSTMRSSSSVGHQIAARTTTGCPQHNVASGTVRYSDWQFPDTLNPFQTTSAASFETINGMQESLFTYDQQAHLVPQLAASIPTVQNGGVTDGGRAILIHLKRGLHWSDGAEITSADIRFGWRVGMDKATGPYCTGSCDQIARIDTLSRYTAVLRFKRIFAPAIPSAQPPLWPISWKGAWTSGNIQAAARKIGQDSSFNFEGPNYPTNGAYQVAQFVKDDRIVLHPMKYYSGMTCGGFVKNLIFTFFSAKPSMIAAAASHGTDITQNYTTADLASLKQNVRAYKVYSDPSFTFEHLEFNVDPTYNGRANPLSSEPVRVALALALDKIGLIRSALGVDNATARSVASWTPWVNTPTLVQPFANTKITGQWDPITRAYVLPGTARALKDAKVLLAQTPWKSGFPLSVSTTTGNPVRSAQLGILQNNWARIGVQVVPSYVPATKLFSGWSTGGPLNHGQFQAAMFAFTGTPEPDSFKLELQSRFIDRTQSVHSAINQNYSGINDPIINKAFDAAAGTFNTATRAKNYSLIQERLNQQSYWIGLYFRPQIATADSTVGDFSNNPTSAGPTWNMYSWKTSKVA